MRDDRRIRREEREDEGWKDECWKDTLGNIGESWAAGTPSLLTLPLYIHKIALHVTLHMNRFPDHSFLFFPCYVMHSISNSSAREARYILYCTFPDKVLKQALLTALLNFGLEAT